MLVIRKDREGPIPSPGIKKSQVIVIVFLVLLA
jgi:hypothetical protein